MESKFTFPKNLVSSSKADKDSKLLRLSSTIVFGLRKYRNYFKHTDTYLLESARLFQLIHLTDGRNLTIIQRQGIVSEFMQSLSNKMGTLPENLISCIRLDLEDYLSVSSTTNVADLREFSTRHYYRKEMLDLAGTIRAPFLAYKLWESIASRQTKPTIVLTPLLQISVGHLYYLPYAISCSKEENIFSQTGTVLAFLSRHGYGHDLFYKIMKMHSASLSIYPSDIGHSPENILSVAWQAESWTLSVSPSHQSKIEDDIHKRMTLGMGKGSSSIVFHIRTEGWKKDGGNNTHRDCNYRTYIDMIRSLNIVDQSICITGDCELYGMIRKAGIAAHLVADIESSKRQWELLTEAALIVGSASGISHLESISDAPILYLNVLSQHAAHPIKSNHMFSIRNLRLKSSSPQSVKPSRTLLFFGLLSGFDEARNEFNAIFEVKHLDLQEMISDYEESIWFFNNRPSTYPYTNKALACELGISYDGPVRNMTRRSYIHLLQILRLFPEKDN